MSDLSPTSGFPAGLSRRQKAAVIVHLLVTGGADPGLRSLPPRMQKALVSDIASLRMVDRRTLAATVAEFAEELDGIGLHFPRDEGRVLAALDGQLSNEVVEELMAEFGDENEIDTTGPWAALKTLAPDVLETFMSDESDEVCAIMLSKLEPKQAADILKRLPAERSEAVTSAFARTESVTPAAVARIGLALGRQSEAVPSIAFEEGPAARVAAILTASTSGVRNELLKGLDAGDPDFAARVRAAVFTFENVPQRISPRDVPRLLRGLNNDQVVALLGGTPPSVQDAVTFVFDNISARLADQLRDEISERGTIPPEDGEAAMAALVAEVRRLEEAGELVFNVDR
jgi:flagellar motor switch protein FliG